MRYFNNNAYLLKGFILIYFGFVIGKYVGFKEGASSEQFDRVHANRLLQQCLRIVRHE